MTPQERKLIAMLCLAVTECMEVHDFQRQEEFLEAMGEANLFKEVDGIFLEAGLPYANFHGMWDKDSSS